MGIYAITGASSGIGAETKKLLENDGNKVINIDLKGGDICVNLATDEGRQKAVSELHKMCPDGIDGMICNAGVSGACGNLELIISLNYFGTVAVAKGAYDIAGSGKNGYRRPLKQYRRRSARARTCART